MVVRLLADTRVFCQDRRNPAYRLLHACCLYFIRHRFLKSSRNTAYSVVRLVIHFAKGFADSIAVVRSVGVSVLLSQWPES